MESKHISNGRSVGMPLGVGLGGAAGLAMILGGSAIIAKLIDMEMLAFERVGYGIMLMLLASSFLGAKISYSRVKRRKLMVCMLSGVLLIGLLLSITALFFGGQYKAIGVTSCLVLAGSCTAGITGYQKQGRGSGRKPNRLHR